MKLDRLEFSIAVTVAVSSAALIAFHRSALAVEVLICAEAVLILSLVYFDWRRTRRSNRRLKSLFLSSVYWLIWLGLVVAPPGNFVGYAMGVLAAVSLGIAFFGSKGKPAEPPILNQPEQISTP